MNTSGLLRGTALLTLTGIFSQVLAFFYRIALSRLIGAETMGLFQLIMPLYSVLLAATAVGLTAAVSTLSAKKLALDRRGEAKALVHRCLGFFLLLGGGLGILLATGSDGISVYILGDARTQLGLILLAPCLLLTGVENLQKHFFYGTGNIRPPALLELGEQIIRTAAVLGLLSVFLPQNPERTVGLIVAGMVICEIFSACALSLLFRRQMADVACTPAPGLTRELAGVALPVGATALLGNLLGAADAILVPQLLVAGGATVSDAMSRYGVMFGMTAPLLCLPTVFIGALGLVLMPDLSERIALGQKKQACRTVENCMLMTSVILLPTLAWLVAVGPELGTALFREPTVGQYIAPLALGVLFSAHHAVLSSALNGVGRQRSAAANALVSGVVQLVITVATVKTWGLAGYVAGFVVSEGLAVWLNRRTAGKALGLRGAFFSRCLAPGLAAMLMGLCVHLLFHTLLDWGLSLGGSLLACGLFGTVLYLAALQAQGVRWPKS